MKVKYWNLVRYQQNAHRIRSEQFIYLQKSKQDDSLD